MESYDLLEVPKGYQTASLLVISPFFNDTFFERVLTTLRPKRVRIAFDDGAAFADIERIRRICKEFDHKIALGRTAGLVHLKGYLATFVRTRGRKQTLRKFIFGSGNATHAAFCGERNAELLAFTNLSATDDADTIEYLESVSTAIERGNGSIEAAESHELRYPVRLRLPAFSIVEAGHPRGFDAWLQRGRLVAKYRDPQQFLAVAIHLKKRLPAGDIERMFSDQGLAAQGERNIVRHRYISTRAKTAEDDSEPQWKAQYCVWTLLGDWISEECYDECKDIMISKAGAERSAKVAELEANSNDSSWRNTKKADLLRQLTQVWQALQRSNYRASDYLVGDQSQLNDKHYSDLLEKKISIDAALIKDRLFRDRYVNGYEFSAVPKFRQDETAWQAFIRSWCESIAIEAGKRASRSLVMRTLRETLRPTTLSALNIGELTEALYGIWPSTPNAPRMAGERVSVHHGRDGLYLGRVVRVHGTGSAGRYDVQLDDGEFGTFHADEVLSAGSYLAQYFD